MSEITSYEMLSQWADIVIQRWTTKINNLKVTDTLELMRSFTSQVYTDSQGDPVKVVFGFVYYGIFPDMGVGRGVKYEDVPTSNRQAKPWYSNQFHREVLKLGYLMAERYGDKAMEAISMIESKDFIKTERNGKK